MEKEAMKQALDIAGLGHLSGAVDTLLEGLDDEGVEAVGGVVEKHLLDAELDRICLGAGVRSLTNPEEAAAAYRLCTSDRLRARLDYWVREALQMQDPMCNDAQADWANYRELCQ